MKSSLLIVSSLLVAFTGCGRGWFSCLHHRGAPCYGQCAPASHSVAADCNGCENTVGYGSEYAGGEVLDGSVINAQPYSTLPHPTTPGTVPAR